MKKVLLVLLAALPIAAWTQCNTTNATDCHCLDGSSDCDLLPDITASYDLLEEPDETIENPGQIMLSVGTPNIGHGPLRVLPTDYYVCGGDTIYEPGGMDACPDGSAPHQIINQRIYHKNGEDMSYWDRMAGTMTYHPTHGHFHTDNWGNYTLRAPIDGEDDPTAWPVIGYGTKMGFCLMDLADCDAPSSYGYCREDDGTVVTDEIENYGLGGGNYNCGVNNQGISVGWLDIYDYYLDGMEIIIPEGVCNGDYYIVVEIDPNNNYNEESDGNNMIAMPFTLTEQPEDIDFAPLTITGGYNTAGKNYSICATDVLELGALPVGTSYAWSNGATTSSIVVSEPGDYYCVVERSCGPLHTDTIHVDILESVSPAIDPVEDVCAGDVAIIEATGDGTINWYDAAEGGTLLASGESFTTPELFENTTYYAENLHATTFAVDTYFGEAEHEGDEYSEDYAYNGYQVFDATSDFTLETVKVITDYPGLRRIELRNADATVLDYVDVDFEEGTTVVELNFEIPAGLNYQLGTNDDINDEEYGNTGPKLMRSTEDLTYPYILEGVATVTNSSFDETRWYYFYDWKVSAETTLNCASDRTAIDVAVKVCSAIGDMSNLNSFEVYPNPSNGIFSVEFNTNTVSDLSVSVTNITGQQLFVHTVANASGNYTLPVDLSAQPSGVYLVKINSGDDAVTKHIVIE